MEETGIKLKGVRLGKLAGGAPGELQFALINRQLN
jgi:hypothetical protein